MTEETQIREKIDMALEEHERRRKELKEKIHEELVVDSEYAHARNEVREMMNSDEYDKQEVRWALNALDKSNLLTIPEKTALKEFD